MYFTESVWYDATFIEASLCIARCMAYRKCCRPDDHATLRALWARSSGVHSRDPALRLAVRRSGLNGRCECQARKDFFRSRSRFGLPPLA